MANLIDTTYFIGDIEIPNVSQTEIKADVNNSIVNYEKEVLIALLGYNLYKDLLAAILAPVSGDKWDKLINGEEFTFTVNGVTKTRKWEGLKGLNKKSVIAYYIFYLHQQKRQTYSAGVGGEVSAATENSVKVDYTTRMVRIWNEFISMYGDNCSFSNDYLSSIQHDDAYPSAYNYLLAKKADFPTWEFESQGGDINIFGI